MPVQAMSEDFAEDSIVGGLYSGAGETSFQWMQIRFWVSPQCIPTRIASRSKTDNDSRLDRGGNSFKYRKSRIIGASLEIG